MLTPAGRIPDEVWERLRVAVEAARLRPHSWSFKPGPSRSHFTPENPGVCRTCGQERYYGRRVKGGRTPRFDGTLPNALTRTVLWAGELSCPAAKEKPGC